jgi:hypothetical protein
MKLLFLAFYHLTLLFTVLPKESDVEYAANMCNGIPSTLSSHASWQWHTMVVHPHIRKIKSWTAAGWKRKQKKQS